MPLPPWAMKARTSRRLPSFSKIPTIPQFGNNIMHGAIKRKSELAFSAMADPVAAALRCGLPAGAAVAGDDQPGEQSPDEQQDERADEDLEPADRED